jgi:hypothetical protein
MESAEDVRASLAVALLGDLRRHEATSPDGEAAAARRYPERLWQFADHRIPRRLFADEAGRRAYTDALAQAALPVASSIREPRQSRQSCQW